jgi:hypothetical protein
VESRCLGKVKVQDKRIRIWLQTMMSLERCGLF